MVLFLGDLSCVEGPLFGQKLILGAGLPSEIVQQQLLLRAQVNSTCRACELSHCLEFHLSGVQVPVGSGDVLNAFMTL